MDLSNNRLKEFFSESRKANLFSKYKQVKRLLHVHSLNLLNNLDLKIQDSVVQVQALMPNLKCLQISLSIEEDVSFIIEAMPQLEMLNGLKVEREKIFDNSCQDVSLVEQSESVIDQVSVSQGTINTKPKKSIDQSGLQLGHDASQETINVKFQQHVTKDAIPLTELEGISLIEASVGFNDSKADKDNSLLD